MPIDVPRGLSERPPFEPLPPRLPSRMGVKGFVDIHCHMLAGMDDGPKDIETSRRMAAAAYSSGTQAAIVTPHCSFRFPFNAQQARLQLDLLEQCAPKDLTLFLGCELELTDESMRLFHERPLDYSLNGGHYMLVETAASGAPPNLEKALRTLVERGFIPILAHPERCSSVWKEPERLAHWVRNGCLMQITAASLSGRMGRRARSAAETLLREGLVHFVASDAHDPWKRPPGLNEAFHQAVQLIGVASAARLFTYNGLCVLHDEAVG